MLKGRSLSGGAYLLKSFEHYIGRMYVVLLFSLSGFTSNDFNKATLSTFNITFEDCIFFFFINVIKAGGIQGRIL